MRFVSLLKTTKTNLLGSDSMKKPNNWKEYVDVIVIMMVIFLMVEHVG